MRTAKAAAAAVVGDGEGKAAGGVRASVVNGVQAWARLWGGRRACVAECCACCMQLLIWNRRPAKELKARSGECGSRSSKRQTVDGLKVKCV